MTYHPGEIPDHPVRPEIEPVKEPPNPARPAQVPEIKPAKDPEKHNPPQEIPPPPAGSF